MSVKKGLSLPVGERDWVTGPENARITLVEYGDFECPQCGKAYPAVKELLADFPEDVRLVFRHFPLKTIHDNAENAALAAEAAGHQGKFWEMHSMLFENRFNLEPDDLFSYGTQLGLDSVMFEQDILEKTYSKKVTEDFRSGVRSGVNGTPTFFINGDRYNGLFYKWDLSEAIKKYLK
ncbi:MAG: thioredoxin domain-containing protein [Acidobacteria bacterium]|nr:thioredoxin domain-containing protein [Acidobacteriota bacterium]